MEATAAAIEQYSSVISSLQKACQDCSTSTSDFGNEETHESQAQNLSEESLKMYELGALPTEDDPQRTILPKDPIAGFRGAKITPKGLFGRKTGTADENYMFRLPSLTSIGRIAP